MVAAAGLTSPVSASRSGPMPQTREHLDAPRLGRAGAGVVALTKSDLAATLGEEHVEAVRLEVRELVAQTFLEGAAGAGLGAHGLGSQALAGWRRSTRARRSRSSCPSTAASPSRASHHRHRIGLAGRPGTQWSWRGRRARSRSGCAGCRCTASQWRWARWPVHRREPGRA